MKNRIWSHIVLLALVLALCLAGCGGGTVSTSKPSSSISGTVKASTGSGVAGVTVTNPESGESTITDSAGNFSLGTVQGATSQLSLLVEVGELSANVDLGKAPTEEAEIVVDVVLDTNAQKVQKATVDVRPKKRPTPRPTATPAPTTEFPLPLPTTAATPNPEPSATPSSPNETPGPIATPEAGMPVTGTVMLRSGAPAAGAMLRFVVAGRKISATVSEDGTFSTEAFPAFGKLKKTVVVKYHGLASVVNLAKTSLGKVPAGAFLTRLDLELSFAHQASGAKILKVNIAMLEYTFASALKAPVQLKPLVLQ